MNIEKVIIEKFSKSESCYLQIPKEKVGKLGGFTTLGYIAKVHHSFMTKPKYYAAKELVSVVKGWQWQVCYMRELNKKAVDPMKIVHEFDDVREAIKFLEFN